MNRIEKIIEMREVQKLFSKYKNSSKYGRDRKNELNELSNYIEDNFLELKNCINIKTAYEIGEKIKNADISNLNLYQINFDLGVYIYGMFLPMLGFIDIKMHDIKKNIKDRKKLIKRIKKNPYPTETMQYEHIDRKESEIEQLKVDIYNYEVLRQKVIYDYNKVKKYFKKNDLLGKELETVPFYKEFKVLYEIEGHFDSYRNFKTKNQEIESFSNAISDYMLGYGIMIFGNKENILIEKYDELSDELNHLMNESKLDKKRVSLLLKKQKINVR